MADPPVLTKKIILQTIHDLTPELHTLYRVRRMGLFGSYASETAHQANDIDILLEFEPGADIWD